MVDLGEERVRADVSSPVREDGVHGLQYEGVHGLREGGGSLLSTARRQSACDKSVGLGKTRFTLMRSGQHSGKSTSTMRPTSFATSRAAAPSSAPPCPSQELG